MTVRNDDSTAPTYSSAAVDGAALVITFNENIDATSEPATSAFTVVGDAVLSVTNVDISDADVTLTLSPAVGPRRDGAGALQRNPARTRCRTGPPTRWRTSARIR